MHLICRQCSTRLTADLQLVSLASRNEVMGEDLLALGQLMQEDGSSLPRESGHPLINLTDGGNGYRKIFNLGANEYLFNSEGFSFESGNTNMTTLFTNTNPSVRAFTVGELCEAIGKASPIGGFPQRHG